MRKGIEPLIAAILLVAFTVAIAALVLGFYNSFAREQTSEARESSQDVINCGNSAIEVFGVNIDSTDLIVNVRNLGSYDFTDIDLSMRNTSTSAISNVETNANLTAGSTKSIIVDSWGTQSIYEVTANTECSGIYSTSRNTSGTFSEVF